MEKQLFFYLVVFLFLGFGCNKRSEISPQQSGVVVVLGSSTAAGQGVSQPGLSWVNRYKEYLQAQHSGRVQVVNLAVVGYTTFHVLPTSRAIQSGRPAPDTAHNITRALTYKPTVIIVNLPSNDITYGYSTEEVLNNFKTLVTAAGNVPVWITTPQPKNFEVEKRKKLRAIKQAVEKAYPGRTIDFWTVLANADDTINPKYNVDGTHINDAGHEQLFQQVVKAGVVKEAAAEK